MTLDYSADYICIWKKNLICIKSYRYGSTTQNHANFCKNIDRKNDYIGIGTIRYGGAGKGTDPGQGGNSTRSTAFDLCRETIGRWKDYGRLQHPEGVDSPSGPSSSWRDANFCEDTHRKDHHP